jgi:ligand-binding SRPBCC domain-containing protein
MAFYQLYREQKINASLEEMWDFISSPGRLKEITTDYMRFDITSKHIPKKCMKA